MKLLTRCPHCVQMVAVESAMDWHVGELLFTVCDKCDENFMVRKNSSGLEVFKDLTLPKPTRMKLKMPTRVL